MKYRLPKAIWNDIRNDINEYTAEDLLHYYRSAQTAVNSKEVQDREDISPDICCKVIQRVDSIILSMKCSVDHRVFVMAKILELEFCNEPTDSSTKIEKSSISRSTYYNYYHEAIKIFSEMVESLK